MSRAPAAFKQSDLAKALKAARTAGLKVSRVEVAKDGRIIIVMSGESPECRSAKATSGTRSFAVTKIKLAHIQAFRARGHVYYYFRKPGCPRTRLPGPPGSAEFMEAYQAALTANEPPAIGRNRNAPGTIAALIAAYANSARFKHELAPATRERQWQTLQHFRDEHGAKRAANLKREHIVAILADKKPYPRRNWLFALRPLMQFAIEIGMIAANPTDGIKIGIPTKSEGFRAWGEDEIAIFRRHYPIGSLPRLAFELLLCTVQRRADVIHMGPQHIRNGLLHVRQQKTGATLALPILTELQAALDATPSRHLTFLVTAHGEPYTPHNFGNWFRRACAEAGLRGFSAHGLRKAGCRRLAESGCTANEIAAWSGHRTLSEVARYTRSVDQAAMARAGATKMRTSLSNSPEPECQTTEKSQQEQGTLGPRSDPDRIGTVTMAPLARC